MKDPAASLRYIGFKAHSDGGRRLNFSFARPDKTLQLISVEAPQNLFSGPHQMAIQECAGICYETLKCVVADCSDVFPASICLTASDVAKHRKPSKTSGHPRTP